MTTFIDSEQDITFLVGGVSSVKSLTGSIEVQVAAGRVETFDKSLAPFLYWVTTPRTEAEVQNWELENLNASNNEAYVQLKRSGLVRQVPGGVSARAKTNAFKGLRLAPLGVQIDHPSSDEYSVRFARHKGAELTWAISRTLAEVLFCDSEDPNAYADFPTKVADSARRNSLSLEHGATMALTGLAELMSSKLVRFEVAEAPTRGNLLDKFKHDLGFARLWAHAEPLHPMIRP